MNKFTLTEAWVDQIKACFQLMLQHEVILPEIPSVSVRLDENSKNYIVLFEIGNLSISRVVEPDGMAILIDPTSDVIKKVVAEIVPEINKL